MRRLGMFCLLALAALPACSSPTGDDEWERVVGTIVPMFSSVQSVFIPEGITAGRPFTVTVTTIGPSNCTRAAGGRVDVRGRIATVTPYDEVYTAEGFGCYRDIGHFPRGVSVTLPTAGDALIRIRGRSFDALGEEKTYEVAVTVLPGS
jgi:hypothetical protein